MSKAFALATAEAVDLAHALVAFVGETNEIRVLGIKGPSFAFHQLRPPRVSADADVLVEPDGFDELLQLLSERGWMERTKTLASEMFVTHSVTLVHPDWPCDIDLHRNYPGFLIADDVAFEAAWASRIEIQVARISCKFSGFAASAVVMALHSLRISEEPRHRSELRDLVERAENFTPTQRGEVSDFAESVGAIATLGPTLQLIGEARIAPAWELSASQLRDWQRRGAGAFGASSWAHAIAMEPWRNKHVLMLRALWPSESDIHTDRPDLGNERSTVLAYRLQRIGRGLIRLPSHFWRQMRRRLTRSRRD